MFESDLSATMINSFTSVNPNPEIAEIEQIHKMFYSELLIIWLYQKQQGLFARVGKGFCVRRNDKIIKAREPGFYLLGSGDEN